MFYSDALYSSKQGVTAYPVQTHNTSQMSFNPNTGLILCSDRAVENILPALRRRRKPHGDSRNCESPDRTRERRGWHTDGIPAFLTT